MLQAQASCNKTLFFAYEVVVVLCSVECRTAKLRLRVSSLLDERSRGGYTK